MAQEAIPAGDAPHVEPAATDDPLAALAAHLEDDTPEGEATDEAPEEGELELEEEGEEQEPEAPAIPAPVSLNAEEKARYAQLPSEAQQFVAELETRRNAQVQQATTKASEAQRAADARAAQADAQAKAEYAQQLQQFADALAPQRPDPAIAQTDPMRFIAENAQYEAAKAQHDQFVQQVQGVKTEADSGVEQAFVQERDRQLMAIPEVQNEATREAFFGKAFAAAELLGFDRNAVTAKASADEIKMLATVAALKDKADKYDAAMSRQMQRVRSAKGKTIRPGAAQPRSGGDDGALKQFEANPSRTSAAALAEKYLTGL